MAVYWYSPGAILQVSICTRSPGTGRLWRLVPFRFSRGRSSRFSPWRRDLVDGVERQLQPVPADELVPEPLDAELARAAQPQDQLFLLGEDLAARRAVRPVAARPEPRLALSLVAPPPLAQGRAGDAAPSADQAGVADLLVEPDPAEPRARVRVHGPSRSARLWTCWTTLRVGHNPIAVTTATTLT